MTRTVNGERLFGEREKEVLRKMLWQVADFCGVQVLTYCDQRAQETGLRVESILDLITRPWAGRLKRR